MGSPGSVGPPPPPTHGSPGGILHGQPIGPISHFPGPPPPRISLKSVRFSYLRFFNILFRFNFLVSQIYQIKRHMYINFSMFLKIN